MPRMESQLKLNPPACDSDEEGSAGAGLAELQQTMARVVANQKQAARKKQMQILQASSEYCLHWWDLGCQLLD